MKANVERSIVRVVLTALLLTIGTSIFAQQPIRDYITFGTNVRLPGHKGQFIFPPLGYYEHEKFPVLIGGYSVGLTRIKNVSPTTMFKGVVNISRQAFWGDPTSPGNPDYLTVSSRTKSVEYFISTQGLAHFSGRKRFSIGSGLGFEFMVLSRVRVLDPDDPSKFKRVSDERYKHVMPVLPAEISWTFAKTMYTLHYEVGLINRFRGEFNDNDRDKFRYLSFELSRRI